VTTAAAAHTAARVLALLALLSPLWLADRADAQHREFTGRVVSISPQAIAVKGRRGDTVTFARSGKTVVDGAAWELIAVGDQVLVHWILGDGTARHVTLLPSPPSAMER